MLHTTTEEVIESKPSSNDTETIHSNEAEFRFYLKSNGYQDAAVVKIIRGIKSDVDNIIRGKYNSKHKSILTMDEVSELELYLYDFQISPVIIELDTIKGNIMTESLKHYIDYLKWRDCDNNILFDNEYNEEQQDDSIINNQSRTLAEVEMEMNVFRKWNKDIPEELIQEFKKLSTKQRPT